MRFKYLSVTEVISTFIETRFYTEASREIGSEAHKECYNYLTNKPFDSENDYISSLVSWSKIVNPVVISAEERFFDDKLRYCGQPDFIGRIKGLEGIGIIDFKTSKSRQNHWKMQVSAYAMLATPKYGNISWASTMRLRKEGKMPFFDFCFVGSTAKKEPKSFLNFKTLLSLIGG